MTFPARWDAPQQKFQQPDASSERKQRKAKRADALADAYDEVNKRDKNRCRVTGVLLSPSAVDDHRRREHNHIIERSRDKTKREDPANIHLCSAHVHGLITSKKILIEGTDASKPNGLRFHWNPATPEKLRTVVIRSRRKSQREASE
jgi:hypothetical protein